MSTMNPLTTKGLLADIEALLRTYDEFEYCKMRSHDRVIVHTKDGQVLTVLALMVRPRAKQAVGQ